ncbi:MAG TPA: GWxTD domain-containing protein, partial [Thermoanaerobaculia bacterium]
WQGLIPDDDRVRFIRDFWKRRDPTPATAQNEFRDTFERRVAFADRAFGSSDSRGSVTDRGKVFVLLGEPSLVRRRPLTNRDNVVLFERIPIVNGTMEEWFYPREKLPITIGKKGVQLHFVTQRGIGDGVLQRDDVYAFQALAAATNPGERH